MPAPGQPLEHFVRLPQGQGGLVELHGLVELLLLYRELRLGLQLQERLLTLLFQKPGVGRLPLRRVLRRPQPGFLRGAGQRRLLFLGGRELRLLPFPFVFPLVLPLVLAMAVIETVEQNVHLDVVRPQLPRPAQQLDREGQIAAVADLLRLQYQQRHVLRLLQGGQPIRLRQLRKPSAFALGSLGLVLAPLALHRDRAASAPPVRRSRIRSS